MTEKMQFGNCVTFQLRGGPLAAHPLERIVGLQVRVRKSHLKLEAEGLTEQSMTLLTIL